MAAEARPLQPTAKVPPTVQSRDWPCRTEPGGDEPPRLVAALYILMRDHISPGDLEQTMLNVAETGRDAIYSNPHMEAYARALAAFLQERPT